MLGTPEFIRRRHLGSQVLLSRTSLAAEPQGSAEQLSPQQRVLDTFMRQMFLITVPPVPTRDKDLAKGSDS